MGMNTILMLIAGIVMSTMVATQVAPSIVEGVKVKKTQVQTINNQEVIFEAIKRYTTIKQVAPTSIQDLIDAGYLEANVNNNGFGEEYTINVDKALGVATITTRIEDPKAQEAFLNSFMGTSKPTRVGTTNNFQTKYVIPNEIMHGNALLMTGIPIGSTAPDHNTNKYWYNTKDGKATLKVYDNDSSSWTEVNLGTGTSSSPEEKFIAGNLRVFGPYDNSSKLTPNEKILLEIIPSKSGSINITYHSVSSHYYYSLSFYLNGIKIDYIKNEEADGDKKQSIFFKAGDKIEIKGRAYIYQFGIYVAPESAGPPDLKITKFTY